MEKVDITIIGAGVVGLAAARELAGPGRAVALVERNARHGLETSSRNSEVIHSGIYYYPGSLKAGLCVRGKELLYEYCKEHSIPCKAIGKIVTAHDEAELPRLEALYKRGMENGLKDLKLLDTAELRRMEPNLNIIAGILSPSTGILSADLLMDKFLEEAESHGAMLFTKTEVTGIIKVDGAYQIRTNSQEPFLSRIVINASGHNADKIAQMAGINIDEAGYRQRFIKGEYFRIKKSPVVSRLIYPLPGELSLGIHLTPDLNGSLRLGPNSFPVEVVNYDVDMSHRPDFLRAARRYFPDMSDDLLNPDIAGVRPRLARFTGEHPDFIISHEAQKGLPGFVDLIGIDSPGLTSAPAIALKVKELIKDLL